MTVVTLTHFWHFKKFMPAEYVSLSILLSATNVCIFTKMFRLRSLIIHKASAKRAITGRQTDLNCNEKEETLVWYTVICMNAATCRRCQAIFKGRVSTEIAHWIMRHWCIDTLIKVKPRLRPFGCCGFDEHGLSVCISMRRYGRSFWWLSLWKGTQHQCWVAALIFALPRRLLWWSLKSRPSSHGLHVMLPQLEGPQSVFSPMCEHKKNAAWCLFYIYFTVLIWTISSQMNYEIKSKIHFYKVLISDAWHLCEETLRCTVSRQWSLWKTLLRRHWSLSHADISQSCEVC